MKSTLLSLGHGYVASALGRRLRARGWAVIGTTRTPERAARLNGEGVEPLPWPGADPGALGAALQRATHLLCSIPPDEGGDPFLAAHGDTLASILATRQAGVWMGYLSSTAVYGDTGGAWVDEESPTSDAGPRGQRRLRAEAQWRDLAARTRGSAHVFRLAGIYGPGRSPFAQLRNGTARRIIKPGQVFARIHIDDIVAALLAAIDRPRAGGVLNLADDEPAPPQDVIEHAAMLIGVPPPPDEAHDTAGLSPMARSFYAECRRVSNARMKAMLGQGLRHPDYRSGLAAILAAEGPAPGTRPHDPRS